MMADKERVASPKSLQQQEVQQQQEAQYRRLVADSMNAIPIDVSFNDGFALLSQVYHPITIIPSLSSSCNSPILSQPIADVGQFRSLVLEQFRPLALVREVVPTDLQQQQQEIQFRRAITASMGRIPNSMNYKDGFVLLSILYRTGLYKPDPLPEQPLPLVDNNSSRQFVDFGTDSNGRIKSLTLGDYDDCYNFDAIFDLHPIIEHLQMLEFLSLYNCRSIPVELGTLPHLEDLGIFNHGFSGILEVEEEMKLSSLKTLHFRMGSDEAGELSSPLIRYGVPNLERLRLDGQYGNDPIHKLIADCCFRESLTHFEIDIVTEEDRLNESDLELLLFDFLPLFPKLCSIIAGESGIETFTTIADRIIKISSSEAAGIPDNRLRELRITGGTEYKLIDKIRDDPKEKAAVLIILEAFNEVSCLGSSDYSGICPDVDYVLGINHAGRKFMTTSGGKDVAFRPALLPRILERSSKSNKLDYFGNPEKLIGGATGLFHLVQHGPILHDIIVMREGKRRGEGDECNEMMAPQETLQVSDVTIQRQGQKRKTL